MVVISFIVSVLFVIYRHNNGRLGSFLFMLIADSIMIFITFQSAYEINKVSEEESEDFFSMFTTITIILNIYFVVGSDL